LIKPEYVIYLQSDNNGEYSNLNLYKCLQNPARPLYLGESDDILDIKVNYIDDFKDSIIKSVTVDSIVPGIMPNSTQVYIPVSLRFQAEAKVYKKIVSIPKGNFDKEIECFEYGKYKFVFI
jgi:CRISPR-associated protein Cas5h